MAFDTNTLPTKIKRGDIEITFDRTGPWTVEVVKVSRQLIRVEDAVELANAFEKSGFEIIEK